MAFTFMSAITGVAVVLLESLKHLAERDVEVEQLVGVDLNLVGLQLAAKGVDLDHSRHAQAATEGSPCRHDPLKQVDFCSRDFQRRGSP